MFFGIVSLLMLLASLGFGVKYWFFGRVRWYFTLFHLWFIGSFLMLGIAEVLKILEKVIQ